MLHVKTSLDQRHWFSVALADHTSVGSRAKLPRAPLQHPAAPESPVKRHLLSRMALSDFKKKELEGHSKLSTGWSSLDRFRRFSFLTRTTTFHHVLYLVSLWYCQTLEYFIEAKPRSSWYHWISTSKTKILIYLDIVFNLRVTCTCLR